MRLKFPILKVKNQNLLLKWENDEDLPNVG